MELTCKSTENWVKDDIGITFGKAQACDTTAGEGVVNLILFTDLRGCF